MSYNLDTIDSCNDYINFGERYMIKNKINILFGCKNLNKLNDSINIAIDTEGRIKGTQMPIMIQLTDGKTIVILKYQPNIDTIKEFLSKKNVIVFGALNEFKIMGFTPPKHADVQLHHSLSLKRMISIYFKREPIFQKPTNEFYSNYYWGEPSKEHILYAAFDALCTYLLFKSLEKKGNISFNDSQKN